MQIIQSTTAHLDALACLFNDYRIFYQHESNLPAARSFIETNLTQNRSRIFLLLDAESQAVGFCQIYPAMCSLSMHPYYYLSDLYISPDARQQGHARTLMNAVAQHCKNEGAQRLTLDTAHTNTIAQSLYESLGYAKEDVYVTYHKVLEAEVSYVLPTSSC